MYRKRVQEKYYTYEQILNKAMKYCARYESSEWQVLNKMMQWGSLPSDRERKIKILKEQSFVDDVRFADAFVKDKLKFKGWGKKKIQVHLQAKGVSKSIILSALNNLDDVEYVQKAIDLAKRKLELLKTKKDASSKEAKLFRYLLQKGFGVEVVYQCLEQLTALKNER